MPNIYLKPYELIVHLFNPYRRMILIIVIFVMQDYEMVSLFLLEVYYIINMYK